MLETKDFEIICVDDDLEVLRITSDLIQSQGGNTVEFNNVQEAFGYVLENKTKICFILSDLRMDKQNGFDFKALLKKNNIDIPFVIITGYWTKTMSAQAMEVGVDAFLEKPIDLNTMIDMIKKFTESRIETLLEEQEMVDGFIEESIPMLDEIENLILELEEDPTSEQTLNVYFRLLHTIKGTASCVGLKKLADFSHRYEDFINELRNKSIQVNTISINVLLGGFDELKNGFNLISKQKSDSEIDLEKLVELFDVEKVKKASIEIQEENKEQTKKEPQQKISQSNKEEEKMNISLGILNDFMEESGELTVVRNSILKTVKKVESRFRGDEDIELLNELLLGMHDITSNIQSKITQMRQVSLKSVFRPFKRLTRDLSKQLGKKVEFHSTGDDLLIDTTVAKLYNNTLIHIVRNSLDHGLESPEARLKQGKNEVGNIHFNVYLEGENIILQIEDDGKGIDPKVIREKASEKGMFQSSELEKMTDSEVVNLIFESGFSTAKEVSDLSGRGVGMDMVRGSFEKMGGEIFVKSQSGEGSVFTLKIPVPKSVLIINTLLVKTSGSHFLFQMDEVLEVVRYDGTTENQKIYYIEDKKVLDHNGELVQLIELSEVLKMGSLKTSSREALDIVVLRVGRTKFGVLVDEILEFEEVVSRKMSNIISSKELFLGTSLLGNGEVSMIISAEGLSSYAMITVNKEKEKVLYMQDEKMNEIPNYKEYMLYYPEVDACKYAIELDAVERLEQIKIKSIEYSGDNALVHYYGQNMLVVDPLYLIGLKSTSSIEGLESEKNEFISVIVTKYNEKRVGLVVYKMDEIKKVYDNLNDDTIDTKGLKGSIYIDEKTICVIDLEVIYEKVYSRNEFVLVEQNDEEELIQNEQDDLAA